MRVLCAPPAIFTMDFYIYVPWVTSQYRIVVAFVPGRVLGRVAFPGVWSRELGAPLRYKYRIFDCERSNVLYQGVLILYQLLVVLSNKNLGRGTHFKGIWLP